jgi:hypothetical protein
MKLNLLLNNTKGVLNSYVNIDPFTPDEPESGDIRVKGDITPLDWIADNGECEEIISRHTLCYFPVAVVGPTIASWLKKIKKNGSIIIQEVDASLVAEALVWNKIGFNRARDLWFGDQYAKWEVKKSALTIQSVVDFLEGSGFRVMKKRIHNYNFTVVAKRV